MWIVVVVRKWLGDCATKERLDGWGMEEETEHFDGFGRRSNAIREKFLHGSVSDWVPIEIITRTFSISFDGRFTWRKFRERGMFRPERESPRRRESRIVDRQLIKRWIWTLDQHIPLCKVKFWINPQQIIWFLPNARWTWRHNSTVTISTSLWSNTVRLSRQAPNHNWNCSNERTTTSTFVAVSAVFALIWSPFFRLAEKCFPQINDQIEMNIGTVSRSKSTKRFFERTHKTFTRVHTKRIRKISSSQNEIASNHVDCTAIDNVLWLQFDGCSPFKINWFCVDNRWSTLNDQHNNFSRRIQYSKQ